MAVKAFERSALYEDSHRLVEWENELGAKQGRNIQLVPAVAPIVGSKLQDLTGGTANAVRVTIQPPTPVPLIADLTDGQLAVKYTCDDSNVSHPALDRLSAGAENLTIGIGGANSNSRFGDLTSGKIHIVIVCTDATTLSFDVMSSNIVALAIAQNLQYEHFNTIDISSLQSLATIEGKTIDSLTFATTPGFVASTPGLVSSGSTSTYLLRMNNGPLSGAYTMQDGGGGSEGPGLGVVVPVGAVLKLRMNLISDASPFNLITSITAAKLSAAAIDQSQNGVALGTINITTGVSIAAIVDKTSLIGRTIVSMSVSAASPLWMSSTDPIINASSTFGYLVGETVYLNTTLSSLPYSSGPIVVAFGSTDDIEMVFELVPIASYPTTVTIYLLLADMQNYSTLISPGVYSINLAALHWDATLAPLYGKHVVEIKTAIQTAFTNGSTIDLGLTASYIQLKETSGQHQPYQLQYDMGNSAATVTNVMDEDWDDQYVSTMLLTLIGLVPSTTFVDFPIDAATIKSLATTQALGQPSWIDCFQTYGGNYGDIVWPFLLAPWIGSTVVDTVLLGGLTDYGPAPFDGTAFMAFGWTDLNYQPVSPDIENLPSTMVLTGYHMSGLITVNTTMVLQGPYSWRIGTTIPGVSGLPVAYTEPQCLRNRSRHSIIVVADTNFLPDYSYNKVWFWREYSHDGIHWTFIDKYLPLELMSMQLTTDSFLLAGSEYPDWLDLSTHPCTFRGVTSYTDARRFKNETWEWVRFGMSLDAEEGGQGPGPPIFATVMARE